MTTGSAPPGRGTVLAGRYALGEPIGYGGTGLVVRGHDTVLERDVAVKLVRAGEDAAERRAAAALTHPGFARVYDLGQHEDWAFLVFELVEGASLKERLAREGRLPPGEAVEVARQVADALADAHRRGVLHLDLKPANVLLTPEGQVKIVDLGTASTADAGTHPTGTSIRGSPGYVAPEQLRGEAPDERTDVYQLGLVLYELLAGRLPFDESRAVPETEAAQQVALEREPRLLRDVDPSLLPSLEWAVHTAIHPDPAQRFPSMADFREALRGILAATEDATRALPVVPPGAGEPPPSRTPSAHRAPLPEGFSRAIPPALEDAGGFSVGYQPPAHRSQALPPERDGTEAPPRTILGPQAGARGPRGPDRGGPREADRESRPPAPRGRPERTPRGGPVARSEPPTEPATMPRWSEVIPRRPAILAGIAALALLVGVIAVAGITAGPATACDEDAPSFVGELARLEDRLGPVMGAAIACPRPNPDNGDLLQRTTTGLAYVRQTSDVPTFTNGAEHWALTRRGLLYWRGEAVDPPADAVLVPGAPGAIRPPG